jgi:hypothetical protein
VDPRLPSTDRANAMKHLKKSRVVCKREAHVGFQGRRCKDGVNAPPPISQPMTGVQPCRLVSRIWSMMCSVIRPSAEYRKHKATFHAPPTSVSPSLAPVPPGSSPLPPLSASGAGAREAAWQAACRVPPAQRAGPQAPQEGLCSSRRTSPHGCWAVAVCPVSG